jgi:hypothetical protein
MAGSHADAHSIDSAGLTEVNAKAECPGKVVLIHRFGVVEVDLVPDVVPELADCGVVSGECALNGVGVELNIFGPGVAAEVVSR